MMYSHSLVGHKTPGRAWTIEEKDGQEFAAAIGDTAYLSRNLHGTSRAGGERRPLPPTIATRYQGQLDCLPEIYQYLGFGTATTSILHTDQEYVISRPLYPGTTFISWMRVISIRLSQPEERTAILVLEHVLEDMQGHRWVTGTSTLLLRDRPVLVRNQSISGEFFAANPPRPTGRAIPPVSLSVTQVHLNTYAQASGDRNPLHLDPEMARTRGLAGTITHGMLIMGWMGNAVTSWIADQSKQRGFVTRLRASFHKPVFPGDTVTIQGNHSRRTSEVQALKLWVETQKGQIVATGSAEVHLAAVNIAEHVIGRSLNDGSDGHTYCVVINNRQQYALWPADKVPVSGWRATAIQGTKEQCLAYLQETWPQFQCPQIREYLWFYDHFFN